MQSIATWMMLQTCSRLRSFSLKIVPPVQRCFFSALSFLPILSASVVPGTTATRAGVMRGCQPSRYQVHGAGISHGSFCLPVTPALVSMDWTQPHCVPFCTTRL